MTRQIPESRKTAFNIGTGLVALGGLLFGSSFIVFLIGMVSSMGGSGSPETFGIAFACLATVGMLLLVAGTIVRQIAAKGLAGSGVILDPAKARQELEPYTRMAGGMIKDALEETGLPTGSKEPEKVVMIKCPTCGHLNEEDSKFCHECGREF